MEDGCLKFNGLYIPRWVLFAAIAVGLYLGYLILLNLAWLTGGYINV